MGAKDTGPETQFKDWSLTEMSELGCQTREQGRNQGVGFQSLVWVQVGSALLGAPWQR